MSKKQAEYDFTPMGQAIKQARLQRDWTREDLAQVVVYRSIENKGQNPGFQVFIDLMTLFNISVDAYLYSESESKKSTRRRQLEATAKGLKEAKPGNKKTSLCFMYPL